jgi:transposase InsO family protein
VKFEDGTCLIACRNSLNQLNTYIPIARIKQGVFELETRPVEPHALATTVPTFELWHQRLGHLGNQSVEKLIPRSAYREVENLPGDSSSLCDVCVKAKHQRQFERKPAARTTRPLELIHSDLAGPIVPDSLSGFRYFIVYIDDYSRYTWVYFLRSKNATEVVSVFQEFQARAEKSLPGHAITRFRCDNGRGEYDNSLFRGILRVCGISFEPSPPYTQHKNGVSERMIRTIVTKARALIIDSGIDEEFWAEAVNTATYLHARSPSVSVGGITPYERLLGKKPELGHLRRFGCAAYRLIPKEQRTGKFGERSRKCLFLGYVHDTRTIWRLWDPVSKRVIQASDVQFDETQVAAIKESGTEDTEVLKSCIPECEGMPLEEDNDVTVGDALPLATEPLPLSPDLNDRPHRNNNAPVAQAGGGMDTTAPRDARDEAPSVAERGVSLGSPEKDLEDHLPDGTMGPCDSHKGASSVEGGVRLGPPNNILSLRRSRRVRKQTQANNASVGAAMGSSADRRLESDPISYREALGRSDSADWKSALRSEYKSLIDNHTWDVVPENAIPAGQHAIGSKWVFKLKINPDGTTRHKARLVIKGYEQTDAGETFAPVAKLTSLRMIIALAALYSCDIHHMDVVTAFLNPPVDSEVYMLAPEGLEWLDPEAPASNRVCRLRKAIYGLKQAPRLWYHHIDNYLQSIELRQSEFDPNLYISKRREVLLLLYVDDLLIASQRSEKIIEIKCLLQSKYRMNDLGIARQFLGIEIKRISNGIALHQSRFVNTLLKRFDMESCNGVSTPMEAGRRLTAATENDELADQGTYQSLIGSLIYLVTGTRPDIAFAVATLSKFNSCPTVDHLAAAKRVLRYVKKTSSLALVYIKSGVDTTLTGFTDSDFAGDADDRKSTSGYAFLLAGAAISWRAQKQKVVALSSTEAEYVGYAEATKEALWIRRLHDELLGKTGNGTQPIFCDNMSALALVKNAKFHDKSKHIDVKHHFVRHAYESGQIDLRYRSTAEMPADIFTKALARDAHWRHVAALGLKDLED